MMKFYNQQDPDKAFSVWKTEGSWVATIRKGCKHLGPFRTKKDAVKAGEREVQNAS